MPDPFTLAVGGAHLTRVPYVDVPLDPSAVGLTAEQVARSGWAVPRWATESGQVLVGQAIWVVESAGRVIVVDPCGAADPFLRSGPEAVVHQDAVVAAMTGAGCPPDRVDVVVLSHLDGIGMAALVDEAGAWRPLFPRARVVLTETELSWLGGLDDEAAVGGLGALRALLAAGVVDGVATPSALTPEVSLHLSGGHSAGHAIVRVESGGARAVFVGHLALSPIQLTGSPPAPGGQHDGDRVVQVLDELKAEPGAAPTWLIGPVWPHPGVVELGPQGLPRPPSA